MLIAITRRDKNDANELRVKTHIAHEDHLKNYMESIVFGGELLPEGTLDKDREVVISDLCGSLLIMDLPDRAAAQAFHDQDPYTKAGLFDRVIIEEFNQRKPAP